jgi:uncharacterized protein (TIGR02270 family)
MTSLTETEIAEEHAQEAAFLWAVRDAATGDPVYDLADLAVADERLEAHLDGLRVHGDLGWAIARAAVEDGGRGEAFVAALLAIGRRDRIGFAAVLDAAEQTPALRKGVAAALAWGSSDVVGPWLAGLVHNRCPAGMRRIGIAACAARRSDPGEALAFALHGDDPRLLERALRAAGELGRADLRPEVRAAFSAEDAACRFAAGWAGALLGEPLSAPVLWELARSGGPHADRAAAMAARCAPGEAPLRMDALARASGGLGAAVSAAGALGDPAKVPWLIEQMANPVIARRAGYAFATITGADLADDALVTKAPEGFRAGPSDDPDDDDVAMDPDEDLPWPGAAAIDRWWKLRRRDLREGTRYLLGKPIEAAWLEEVLRGRMQPVRAAAAVELCLAGRRRVLFEVRAKAAEQRRALER